VLVMVHVPGVIDIFTARAEVAPPTDRLGRIDRG
jgi:hypothetical protein